MRTKRTAGLVILVAVLATLAACAPGPNPAEVAGSAGFWQGLWHGFISPVTFIVSLFNENVGIYEVGNNGGWYNFGFLFGASMVLGGSAGAGAGGAARHR